MSVSVDETPAPSGGLSRVQGWIAGLTGVVVLMPALVNGAYDVYASVMKVPRSESERISAALFQKYWNKQPLATLPVQITEGSETVQVELKVYGGGDIYVEFGKFSEWFPRPGSAPAPLAMALISAAYAQQAGAGTGTGAAATATATAAAGSYRQQDTLENGMLVRRRLWQNGVLEIKRIDPRTGDASDTASHPSTAAERAAMAGQAPSTPLKTTPINLNQLRASAGQAQ